MMPAEEVLPHFSVMALVGGWFMVYRLIEQQFCLSVIACFLIWAILTSGLR
jgi:hypothetical protein